MKQPPTPPQTINAAIYCRVSTYEQGKGDFSSLDSQEKMLRQYCETKSYAIYEVYRDTESGTTLERKFLQNLLVDATARKFNVLVVTKLDRISRNVKDFLDLDETLNKLGIDIIVTTQNIDTTTPQGAMMRTIMVAFAQFERDMIAERTREKLYNQAKSGYWGGGHVLLGYDAIDKKLVVNHEEAELVRKTLEQYLHLPSTKKVAAWLSEQGYRTKIRTTKSGKTTGGKEFNHQLIHDLLRNRIYTGQITFRGEHFKGLHEAIVTEDLFEKVQKRLDQSARDPYATYEDSPLLLLGLTRCGFCDAQLTTYFPGRKKSGPSYYYYQCTTNSKSGPRRCQSRNLPARELERFTEQLALHTAKDQGFFDAVVRQVKGNAQTSLGEKRIERDAVVLNQVSIKKQLDTFISNLTLAHVDVSQSTEVKSKVESLTTRIKELDGNLNELDREIEMLKNQQIDRTQLKQVFDGFEEMYVEATPEIKRRLLNTIIEEIRCSVKHGEKTGEIEFRLRGDGSIMKKWELAKKKEHGEPGKPPERHFDSPCSLAPRQAPYLELYFGQNPYRNLQSGPRREAHVHGFGAASSRAGAHRHRRSAPVRERALPSQAPEGAYESASRLRGPAADLRRNASRRWFRKRF